MATTRYDASSGDPARTVLIVEDEPLVRMALLEFLEDNGFQALQAANAREALDTIESTGRAIDLVFTDIRMPGEMDGIGLAQWVHHNLPSIPVIVASGHVGNADLAEAAGEDFCAKPYQLDQVVARIRARLAAS